MRFAFLASLIASAPGLAAAQTLTIDEVGKFRRANEDNDAAHPDVDGGDPRRIKAFGANVGGINLDECERGEEWEIIASVGGYLDKNLFVYTGSACDTQDARTGGEDDDCKLIETIPLGTNSTQEITLGEHDMYPGIDALPANEIANIHGETCEDLDDNLRVWLVILVAEGDETPVASLAFPQGGDIRVKTGRPEAPSDVTAGPGEGQVELDWDGATEGQRYYVACSPMPGEQGSGGGTTDAGQEVCGAPATAGFAEGAVFDRSWRCDQGSETVFADGTAAESASIDGLTDGTQYSFAVVSVDEVGNPSLLSELACSTPQPVDDFFENYRDAGGTAGGGICACTTGPAAPSPTGGGLVLLSAAGLAILFFRRRALAALAAAAVVLSAGTASADGLRYLQDDYRSPQNFAFEIRGGPYYPDVDDEFGGSATPFEDSFEDHARLRLGFEFDWQALRTPVASLGVGFAASLMRFVGNSRFEGSDEVSSEETTLIVMPMVVSAVVRFDFAVREWQIPLAPYAKVGFATYLWYSEDGNGTARADGEDGENSVLGAGRTHGLELAGGLAFLLDFLEPNASRKLDTDTGVNHSYLFLELLWANVDGFGANGVLNLSDTTWNVGLLLEI